MDILTMVDNVKEKLTDKEYKDLLDCTKSYYERTEQITKAYALMRKEFIKLSITFRNVVSEWRMENDKELNEIDIEWMLFLNNHNSE